MKSCSRHPKSTSSILGWLALLWQYMRRTIYDGGLYEDVTVGIPLGCPLSPLMGALYLKPIDDAIAETGMFYARFMDDWVALAPTRWKLRATIKTVNETLEELEVQQHPDKTFVGRIRRGFDFLGYRFASTGLIGVARQSVERFVERATRLYEQGADRSRIGEYVRRWLKWVKAGVGSVWLGKKTCCCSDLWKYLVEHWVGSRVFLHDLLGLLQ